MASIAAISQMEIISKIHDDELGTKLIVETNENKFEAIVVEKPFYDPKKKIASS